MRTSLLLSLFLVQQWGTFFTTVAQPPPLTAFDWSTITPSSESLNWASCYSSYQCTRLSVPIDYSAPQGDKAAIAIIKVPSKLQPSDPNYKGPLFFNPGGPGASGVEFMLAAGAQIAKNFGPDFGNFDFISWDVRGVGVSTPTISFLKTPADRTAWDFTANGADVNSTSPTIQIPRLWAQSQVWGGLAKDRDNGIMNFVTTEDAARDIEVMRQAFGLDKIQFYGVSYGSVLGGTYATLFPDKIERMVLDAIVNATAWFRGDWAHFLLTIDKGMQDFFDECHSAGPAGCAFYDTSSAKIQKNFNQLLDQVRSVPVPVFKNATYGLVDYGTVRLAVLGALYNPNPGFSKLAAALSSLSKGDGLPMLQFYNAGQQTEGQCTADTPDNAFEALSAISCSDILPQPNSPTDLVKYYYSNLHITPFMNEFMRLRILCAGWQFNRKHFTGPLKANTSFPILMVGNTGDTVSPVAAAVEMSKGFPGSAVLVQDSPGHASFSSPSTCTSGAIMKYLINGTLPAANTVCPLSQGPFPVTTVHQRALEEFESLSIRKPFFPRW